MRAVPVLKSWARIALSGGSRVSEGWGRWRGGFRGRGCGEWEWAVRRKESRSMSSPVGIPLLDRRRSSHSEPDFPVRIEQIMVDGERGKWR